LVSDGEADECGLGDGIGVVSGRIFTSRTPPSGRVCGRPVDGHKFEGAKSTEVVVTKGWRAV
jgi:hypothetical protein